MACQNDCLSLVLQLLIYGLTNGAVVALNAVGFSLAYAVAGQMNLAHGNVFALTTVLVTSLARAIGASPESPFAARLALLVALAVSGAAFGAILNVVVERLAFRPFGDSGDRLGPLIASVALSFVLLGVAVRWHAAYNVPQPGHQGVNLPLLAMPDLVPRVELRWNDISFTLKDGAVLLLALTVVAATMRFLTRAKDGRLLRAVAEDRMLAALLGGDPRRAQALAFALAGALAGFAAAIFASYYGGASSQHGLRGGLAAMTAAVLGGVGDPLGALVAGVLLGILGAFSDYLLDAYWTPVVLLVLLIGLLAARPRGLLASAADWSSGRVAATTSLTVVVRRRASTEWLLLPLLGLALALPWLDQLSGGYRLQSAATALLIVTLALGLSIVVGFAGLLDLGYAAFFAIGGYSAAILTGSGSRLGFNLAAPLREPWLALPLAGLLAAAFGLVFGLPSVRARGEYLAIITLAFGEIVPSVIWHLPELTGGPRGMSGLPSAQLVFWAADSALHSYALALLLATSAGLLTLRLARSRTGRAWAAVRDDEVAAAAAGVDPPRAKLQAFAIGAGLAGLAGAVWAGLYGYVEPSQFDFTLSLMILAAVVIGGRWGIVGVVLGALLIAGYQAMLVDVANGVLHALGGATGQEALIRADLRGDNFAVFGLVLYLAVVRPRISSH